ncbi:DUF2270 domain-containing protein [Rhizobium sullae]|uniref:DUF2270 domain-containing protein n=1 Tax=Rhizobium sullae TaxID=50338 RepID=UPI000B3609CD
MDTELGKTVDGGTPPEIMRPSLPASQPEITNTLSHYYRGELGRMTSWRDRIDRTSNWAITVVAALLSVSLSTPTAHHGVLLFGIMLISLLLLIEARRYRFFDIYRARVRQVEKNYFAQILSPDANSVRDWGPVVASSLRKPKFLLTYHAAVQRRLQRNYSWMYLIMLLAWALKITTPKLQAEGSTLAHAQSWTYVIDNAVLGPLPGLLVIALVAAFYLTILYGVLRREPDQGEFIRGEAHV